MLIFPESITDLIIFFSHFLWGMSTKKVSIYPCWVSLQTILLIALKIVSDFMWSEEKSIFLLFFCHLFCNCVAFYSVYSRQMNWNWKVFHLKYFVMKSMHKRQLVLLAILCVHSTKNKLKCWAQAENRNGCKTKCKQQFITFCNVLPANHFMSFHFTWYFMMRIKNYAAMVMPIFLLLPLYLPSHSFCPCNS